MWRQWHHMSLELCFRNSQVSSIGDQFVYCFLSSCCKTLWLQRCIFIYFVCFWHINLFRHIVPMVFISIKCNWWSLTQIFVSNRIVSPKISKFNSFYSQPIESSFTLTCNVYQGTQPVQFKWFKNDQPIETSRVEIETKKSLSFLTLPKIDVNDSANFSCIASNLFGFDRQWSVLQVKGLPSINFLFTLIRC